MVSPLPGASSLFPGIQGGKGQPMPSGPMAGKGGGLGGGINAADAIGSLSLTPRQGMGRRARRRERRQMRQQDAQLQALMDMIRPPEEFPGTFGGGR